ncbi:hypothetical protein GM658_07640 [Pseudoduganella eburnea]|jgi:antitoxin (DNA-binding transcriptional repressor) of toxin-antitoxin stability system|uniref:Uncharacterized protein n=1 Tax=Massilia eburnea TaxID=1776165 RepID=A0A6L6QEI5_9BURK|nr:hypothetical protein [Massilia eburnea]MTW10474.1 hypothetical protein [Massilia eburnea]
MHKKIDESFTLSLNGKEVANLVPSRQRKRRRAMREALEVIRNVDSSGASSTGKIGGYSTKKPPAT